jgi:hypothetical protein
VREWFAGLDPKPEGVTAPGSRGRLAPSLIEAFAKANPREKYSQGTKDANTVSLRVTKTAKSGKTRKVNVDVPVEEARTLAGDLAGKRGRLSAAALTAAADALSAQSATTATAVAPASE